MSKRVFAGGATAYQLFGEIAVKYDLPAKESAQILDALLNRDRLIEASKLAVNHLANWYRGDVADKAGFVRGTLEEALEEAEEEFSYGLDS